MGKHSSGSEEDQGQDVEQEAKAELREPAADRSETTGTSAGPRPPDGPPAR